MGRLWTRKTSAMPPSRSSASRSSVQNRLVAQIAARGDDGKTKFRHQQMMQRVRRQHRAEIGIAGAIEVES